MVKYFLILHDNRAQVAGAAGKKTRGLVHAVVALDPAGPLFSLDDPSNRVHHTDAEYVESIITDGGRLGFEHPIGHANFYVNWGKFIYSSNQRLKFDFIKFHENFRIWPSYTPTWMWPE